MLIDDKIRKKTHIREKFCFLMIVILTIKKHTGFQMLCACLVLTLAQYMLINSQHRHESVVVFLLQKNKKCFSRYMQVTKVYIQ